MAFDITTVASVEMAICELKDADDSPLMDEKGNALSVTVYGPGSKAYVKATTRRQSRNLERLRRKGKPNMTAEENVEDAADFLATCTVSFNGWDYPPAGKAEGFALFKAAYADSSLGFIRDQVAEFISDWANFTSGSVKS